MTATVLRFPVRPALRLVEAVPPATSAHFRQEIGAVQSHLRQAARRLGAVDDASIAEFDTLGGIDDLEAALFFALTLKGCLNDDRDLRNLLLARMEKREAGHGN